MPEVEVHRRLVKSPPELWAELSDVEGLARHLGEFGEIRITRTDPETTVAWEGERARGKVEIEPSGWGTKVTLTAEPVSGKAAATEKAKPDPDPAAGAVGNDVRPAIAKPGPEPRATPEPHPVAKRIAMPGAELIAKQGPEWAARSGSEPTAKQGAEPVVKPNPELIAKPDPKPVAKPAPLAEPQAARAVPEPKPAQGEPPAPPAPVPTPVAPPPKKPGFFARLFRRRKHIAPDAWEPDPAPAPIAEEKPNPEPMRAPAAEAKPDSKPEPAAEAKPEPIVEPEPKAEETPAPRATPEAEGERDTKWVVNADPERLVNRDPIGESQAKPEPAVEAAVPEVEPVVTDERAIAVLTAALDALGSAHHRPFSRG
jgi:hypothetical protein